MTNIVLSTDESATGGSVIVGIDQNLIHPDRWWLLSGIELLAPHGVEDHTLVVIVGMMHNLTVVTNQIDLHRRVTSLAPGAGGVWLPWPCAVHVPPRQNLTFSNMGRRTLTPSEATAWDRLRIRAQWESGRNPRAQMMFSVDTLAELRSLDTSALLKGDLCVVEELQGLTPKLSRHQDRWTATVVFVPNEKASRAPDNDTIFRAPTGIWVRIRDVP